MFILIGRLGFAFMLLALCLSGQAAHAQAAAVPFWFSPWPLGFGSNPPAGQSSSIYDGFSSFDGGGMSSSGRNFPNGWFVGAESGSMGLNGFNQAAAFGNFGPSYEGVQFGYNFQGADGSPFRVYAGFDTLKYQVDTGSPFAAFDSQSSTLPGYSAHAGVEFKPTSNLSLSLGVGYAQQPSGDYNSLLLSGAGTSPFTGRH